MTTVMVPMMMKMMMPAATMVLLAVFGSGCGSG